MKKKMYFALALIDDSDLSRDPNSDKTCPAVWVPFEIETESEIRNLLKDKVDRLVDGYIWGKGVRSTNEDADNGPISVSIDS